MNRAAYTPTLAAFLAAALAGVLLALIIEAWL